MIGYRDGHMAVEAYKGSWILRAALEGDLPVSESAEASAAMTAWRASNRDRFKAIDDAPR